jgi:hypothetical protein
LNPETNEMIHCSVLKQKELPQDLMTALDGCPGLLTQLAPIEKELQSKWQRLYDPNKAKETPEPSGTSAATDGRIRVDSEKSFISKAKDVFGFSSEKQETLPAPTVRAEMMKRSNSGSWRWSLSRAAKTSRGLNALSNGDRDAAEAREAGLKHLTSFSHFASLVVDILRTERR